MPATSTYTVQTRLAGPIDEIRPRVEAALRQEGFGVLTEIDVRATLAAKLGVDWPPYVILGACNPPLAHRALQADPSVGALLPCNVVLREVDGETLVEAIDPLSALGVVDHPGVAPVATEARERLERALRSLEAGA
jgi:uncharacterized protein (DUF302 family)